MPPNQVNTCMKKLLILSIVTALSGCSALQYITPRQFDNIEYKTAVEITQLSTRIVHQCTNVDVTSKNKFIEELNTSTMFFEEYVTGKKDEDDIFQGAKNIRSMVLEFDSHTAFGLGIYSRTYCIDKVTNIQNAARTTARAISRQDKISSCQADLISLWTALKAQKTSGIITVAEYKELSNDIVRLGNINIAACSSQEREHIEQGIAVIKQALSLLPI